MMYRYQVLDKKKKLFQGEVEADSIQRARISLLQQGYDVLLLEEVRGSKKFVRRDALAIGIVSLKEKMLFVKHLALMIKSGLVLDEALEALYSQSRGKMKHILERLLGIVRKGNLLSDGLQQFPFTFSDFFVNMVRIGEKSGTLEMNLIHLSVKLKKEHDLRSKIRGAMMYPVIVVMALGGLGIILTVVVLPKLLGFFDTLAVEVPPITKLFIALATFAEDYWALLVLGFIVLVIVVIILNRARSTRFVIHWLVFNFPLFHQFSKTSNLANFCRSLNLLLKSGMTIDDALEIMTRAASSVLYQNSIREALIAIRKGEPLSESLASAPHYFPSLITKMIRVGEISGSLSETFDYLAEFYEDELDNLSKNLSTLIEPALLIIIGLLVGFVAMAIISPIYQLTGGISR